MIKHNHTNEGTYRESAKRGQTIETPVGKDSSDYSGKPSDEITSKMRMPFNANASKASFSPGDRGSSRKIGADE